MAKIANKSFFSSWSGGKDACLALYRAIESGGKAAFLFTMLEENGEFSRSHRIPIDILKKQAQLLQIPLMTRSASWGAYEKSFSEGVTEIKKFGVTDGVFGDIDIDGHLEWVQNTCSALKINPHHPLWKESRKKLILEFIDSGFVAKIAVIRDDKLPKSFLGRDFSKDLIEEMERLGVDPCGENGEFHTIVVDGPIFSEPLKVKFGEHLSVDGVTFQTMSLE